MFSLHTTQSSSSSANQSYTINVLPCRIHHDGPIDLSTRHWQPTKDDNEEHYTAYFRGRKLRGRRVEVPEGYKGVIATPTDRTLPPSTAAENEEQEEQEPVKALQQQGTFDAIVVWGHENVPPEDDPHVRGVEEWVKFASVMHAPSSSQEEGK
ncbi:hypothetical protein VTN49DRAFT_5706 [Thermomyces lanuginosus]|uniref:uncharacterized protein n=1 Tax=Thermomyces lanuginosus TaxID=5541 RepID=UPI0037423A69